MARCVQRSNRTSQPPPCGSSAFDGPVAAGVGAAVRHVLVPEVLAIGVVALDVLEVIENLVVGFAVVPDLLVSEMQVSGEPGAIGMTVMYTNLTLVKSSSSSLMRSRYVSISSSEPSACPHQTT